MIRKLVDALDERLGVAPFLRHALRKAFPDHWSFMLGEVAAYCFVFILLSGTYLTFFFHPSSHQAIYHGHGVPSLDGRAMSDAYASVLRISFETQAGLLIRQAHHWCALLFAAAVITHMARVFFTGAYRKPRDLNWVIGLTLLLLVMGDGFTGYSLPDDQLSGAGLRIAQSIALAIPVIGSWVAFLFFGGNFPSPEITNRLYAIHILFIPLALGGLIALHVAILWHQKHTQFPGKRQRENNVVGSPLWPTYAVKSLALMAATFGVLLLLGGLVEINPVWQYGPYDPWTVASPAQPDWYVGWLDGALRVAPPWAIRLGGHTISALLWPGIVLPGVLFGILYSWPWLERKLTGDRAYHELLQFPWQNPLRTSVGVAALTFAAMLLLAASDDVQARLWHVSVQQLAWFYRFAVWIAPVIAAAIAWRICVELQARHAYEQDHPSRVVLKRAPEGGFEEEPVPTP
ncbi:MAG TPA: ubiquinol-cytochrome c reductase cytochrome b subunit [Candidatus Limnocylindrales bacterium]|nr:ubiquinol-cytochrome c reductase cytochrome b subunit [Candidatus Limnocylindrales bacterium]